jgi:hypothetical protein
VNWIEERTARLHCGPLRGRVVIDAYKARFELEHWHGRPVDVAALGYFGGNADTRSLNLLESYVRGADFAARFAEIGESHIAPELLWRAEQRNHFTARLELLLSVRTDLLDSKPLVTCCSSASAGAIALYTASLDTPNFSVIDVLPTRRGDVTVWHPGTNFNEASSREHLFVFRMKDEDLSFAQMVHPSDFASAQITADMGLRPCLTAKLFPEHLEKGVIRRGRICGWFMPAENDLDTAVELAREFVNEPPPLTT